MASTTRVTSVRVDRVLFTVRQFSHLHHISDIGRGAMDVMHQTRLHVGTDLGFHSKKVLIPFLGLVHFGVTLAVLVLG